MKKFIKSTLYFFITLLILNSLLFVLAKEIYTGNYHRYSIKFNSFLFADSHGRALGNITEKYGVYNFSAGSDSYFDMLRKLEFLITKVRVDTIYLSVDDHTLSVYREETNNLDRSTFFVTLNDNSNYYELFKIKYLKNYIILFQPRTRSVIRHFISSKLKKTVFGNQQMNSANIELNWEEIDSEERLIKSKNRLQFQFPSEDTSSKLHESLVQIIKTCRANNIVLIGIKLPLSSDYIGMLGNRTTHADDVLKSEGFKVKDYKKVFINQDEYFANQDHLNEDGSVKFLEILFEKSLDD